MLPDVFWIFVLLVLAGCGTWLGYRVWRSAQGWVKWVGVVLSGMATLLILTIIVLGMLPIPPNLAPVPTAGHTGAPDNAPTAPLVAAAPRILTVHPGESIQSAIDKAAAGDTVEVAAGDYHEALKVKFDNLTLRGIPDASGQWPLLDGYGQLDNAVLATGNFFTIEKFQIHNYTDNGVETQNSYGDIYRDLLITVPGEYGVFPVLNTHVLIERVTVSGAKDAGIYVGQSRDVLVKDSESYANNSGLEIESCVDAVVQGNYVHDNTLGVLVWTSPEPDVIAKEGRHTTVLDNRVENNNAPSIASADFLKSIPPGIGILVLMAEQTEVAHNTIKDNHSAGVGVAQADTFFTDTGSFTVPLIPEQTWLHDNQYTDNGNQPADFIVKAGFPGADILWDASHWNNRFDDTNSKTFPLLPSSTWPDLFKRALWQVYRLLK